MTINFRATILGLCLLSTALQANTAENFVGKYSSSERETLAELFLLDDQSFCFVFMGGAVDAKIAGAWKVIDQEESTIELQQTQVEANPHQVRAKLSQRVDKKISIVIEGYSTRDINSPVFAFSKDNQFPQQFRALLPANNSVGRSKYALPLITPADAKYFYLGSETSSNNDGSSEITVSQFKIGLFDTFQLGFNPQPDMIPESFIAQLNAEGLQFENEFFSAKGELDEATITSVTQQCINAKPQTTNPLAENSPWTMLEPSNVTYITDNNINSDPYFGPDDPEFARQGNGTTALVAYEKQLLESYYIEAKSSSEALGKFLTFSKALIAIEPRYTIYASDLGMKLSQLLVDANSKGDLDSAELIFNTYANDVFPRVKDIDDQQIQYSVSVIASQGLIIYAVGDNKAVLSTVVDTLLGPDFDFVNSRNPTLVYNLACVHSLNRNKAQMLKAVKAARTMDKPREQFMKDGDFAFYLEDSDFLAAIQ
ncbi:hypothetical protein DBZ36_20285 [Alginatibacterium sediminis]|uniref:Uncharacterized protein n=1 Tax=Alginatibacterium sediminis TaxID=2164068 RepID=A0A420E5T6_9ALTE|nr:hypothetical protein [Alginatibacterium sediminis]RKF12804.1 hypothetical protein DBZ36_20285 [Alginatibacterium sediminis]